MPKQCFLKPESRENKYGVQSLTAFITVFAFCIVPMHVQLLPAPLEQPGSITAEHRGMLNATNIRTEFYNFGVIGNYLPDPISVNLSVFHCVGVIKGSDMNYSNGITPFMLVKVKQHNGQDAFIMETGFRKRQGLSPVTQSLIRFEPRLIFLLQKSP